MSVEDFTRLLDPAANRYVGTRLQQGRSLLDSDTNEGVLARMQDFRSAVRDIAGTQGSADQGFMPDLAPGQTVTARLVRFGAVVQAFVLDYPLKPGSMHVGGWRLTQDAPESTVFQREFLQIGPAAAPLAQIGTQFQLSILRAWEQPVTAIEDAELLEAALHGADTVVRMRRMRRVEVRTVDAGTCDDAFREVLAELGDGTFATYDPRTAELRSNARLRLSFLGEPAGDCPGCDPALRGRYLGNEDQAIRLMLASADSYVWGTDFASPLYRARLVFDGSGARVKMLTPPKDTYHEPVLNRVVELLPWSVLLENGKPAGGKTFGESVTNEKLATRVGVFAEVDAPYAPGDLSFHARIDPAGLEALGLGTGKGAGKGAGKAEQAAQAAVKTGEAPAAEVVALEWDPAHPHASELNLGTQENDMTVGFVYLRFWHVKKPDEPLTIPIASGAPLGRTGIVPVFSGQGRRGDFWRATLRTAARDVILPWALMGEDGKPPDGPREVLAPLALVEWRSLFGQSHRVVSIKDCRPSLPAITNRGCCTHIVSTGTFAQFRSVQAAIEALPASGGRVCVREGTYAGEFRISGVRNVVIEGCGPRTVLVSPDALGAEALASLDGPPGASHIVLRSLVLRATGQIGVALSGQGIELDQIDVEVAAGGAAETPSAIRALDVAHCRITRSRIAMARTRSDHAALYVRASGDLLVEDNRFEAAGEGPTQAWGGIQIAGASRGVEIRDNRIGEAAGHGITIGTARWRATNGADLGLAGAGFGQRMAEPPFTPTGRLEPVEFGEDGEARLYYPEPEPPIENLLIAGNQISGCLGSGIAALAPEVIHGEIARRAPLCMRRTTFLTDRIDIRDNVLEDNAAGPGQSAPDRTRGGIVLSEVRSLKTSGNRIEGPARGAGSGPRCGIFVAAGSDIAICSNYMALSGRPSVLASDVSDRRDLSGGIVLSLVRAGNVLDILGTDAPITGARIDGNIVTCAHGPALSMLAGGTCTISANALEAGLTVADAGPFGIAAVAILHPSRVSESVDLPTGDPDPDRWIQPAGSQTYLSGPAQRVATTGALSVADNQIATRIPVDAGAQGVLPVAVLSSGSVTLDANQMSAGAPRDSLSTHCFVIGATVNACGNRIAEGIETTHISLIAMAPMLTLAADNVLTHCPVVFGCENDDDPRYFAQTDNLTWFRRLERRCAQEAAELSPGLRAICNGLFGVGDGGDPDFAIAPALSSLPTTLREIFS